MAKLDKNKWLSSDTFEFKKDKNGNHLAIKSEVPISDKMKTKDRILEEEFKGFTTKQANDMCETARKFERKKVLSKVKEEIEDWLDKAELLWKAYVLNDSRKLSTGAMALRARLMKNPYHKTDDLEFFLKSLEAKK